MSKYLVNLPKDKSSIMCVSLIPHGIPLGQSTLSKHPECVFSRNRGRKCISTGCNFSDESTNEFPVEFTLMFRFEFTAKNIKELLMPMSWLRWRIQLDLPLLKDEKNLILSRSFFFLFALWTLYCVQPAPSSLLLMGSSGSKILTNLLW